MGKKRDNINKEEEMVGEEKKKKKGRIPCCEKDGVRKGAWTSEEDKILVDFISTNGHGTWRNLPKLAGLFRCGKSCRLRWTNYLRPDIRRGPFTPEEEDTIIRLHNIHGNKWAAIASNLAGRTDNDIKNFYNSHLRKRFRNLADSPLPSSSSKSVNLKSEATSNQHKVVVVKPDSPPISTTGDYFIQLWNSEVGETFRATNESIGESSSPSSSLTKVEPPCKIEETASEKVLSCKKEEVEGFEYEEDSSDAMLKLLLDFPVGDNDMGFLLNRG